jgi:hypothetical protein
MQGNEKQAISGRWWFKLIRGSITGVTSGFGLARRGWSKLGKRGKMGTLAALAVLFIIAGIAGQRDDQQAKSLGFASTAEMHEAGKEGFHDKASWSKHLADIAAAQKSTENAAIDPAPQSPQEPAEQPEVGLGDLTFNGHRLPDPTNRFEIFSPPRAFDQGTGVKSVYDRLTDDGDLKGSTIFLSSFNDMSWGDPFFDKWKYGFNDDGSLSSLMGTIASTQSPKIFRQKFVDFCGGSMERLSTQNNGPDMDGEIDTKFAKCTYTSGDELNNAEVMIMYKH